MASPGWSLLAASALGALAASCATQPELPHPQAWAAVRQAYAPQLAEHGVGQSGGGATLTEAERAFDEAGRRDDWAWESARRRDEVDEYELYLREHRDGEHGREAQRRLDQLRAGDEADWSRADLRDSIDAYQYYITNNPDGVYRDRASQRIRELRDLELMRRLHPLQRQRPTGMEVQPQRLPSPPAAQAPNAVQPLTERVRTPPPGRPRLALAPGATAPSPAAPPSVAPPPAAQPPTSTEEPATQEPHRRRAVQPR